VQVGAGVSRRKGDMYEGQLRSRSGGELVDTNTIKYYRRPSRYALDISNKKKYCRHPICYFLEALT
jgi:hypothetical protein